MNWLTRVIDEDRRGFVFLVAIVAVLILAFVISSVVEEGYSFPTAEERLGDEQMVDDLADQVCRDKEIRC